ncbi:flagellin [Marinicaulis aureus]|uniref:Flagellin n=1 Tax=Hyphococcus aureus TaxID=2666033 RepID=A0ABW1KZ56_9PROT
MSGYGFPTLLQYSRLTSTAADLKSRAEQARTEMVTGRIANLKTELGGTIGDVHLLNKAIGDVTARQDAATRALGRTQASQSALTLAGDGIVTIGADLLSAVGQSHEPSINIAGTKAKLQLDAAVSAFNTRYEGRSLFSGDASNLPALADAETLLTDVRAIFAGAADNAQLQTDLDAYFNDPAGGFETTIYTGGSGNAARTEIADGELVDYSAKADEQAVRDLLRHLATVVVADEQTGFVDRSAALSTAAGGLIQADSDITAIRARIGASEERIAAAQTRLEAEKTAYSITYNEHTARDPYEAATLLQQIESQLEASYIMTSRISLLSLTNYLR